MDDLISRAAAIEAMRECWRRVRKFAKPFEANRIMDCIKAVKELPAVDAVSVVRCKDCKYWEPCSDGESGICGNLGGLWESIEFCSDGERRDEGEAD